MEGWTRTFKAHEHDSSKKESRNKESSSSSASSSSSGLKKEESTRSPEGAIKRDSKIAPFSSSSSSLTNSKVVEDVVMNKRQLMEFFNSTHVDKIQAKIDKNSKKSYSGFYGWCDYLTLF